MLLLFPTAFAGIVYSMRNKGYGGIILCGLFSLITVAVSFVVPSTTSMMIFVLSGLIILTIAILKNWFGVKRIYALLLVYLPTTAGIGIPLLSSRRFWELMALVFDQASDTIGEGYMAYITRQLLSGAKFIGQGSLPHNTGAMTVSQILPSINNDFLLTYIIHRFGWVAFIGVVALFAVFIMRALILCLKQKSVLASLVSLSVIVTMTLQTICYIAVNLGFQVFSTLSLPLISQGNAFLLINMGLVGLLLSVFRTGYFMNDKAESRKATRNSFLRFEDGKMIVDFKHLRIPRSTVGK